MRYKINQSFSTTFQRFHAGDEIDDRDILGTLDSLTEAQKGMLTPLDPPKAERPRAQAPAVRESEAKPRSTKVDENE